MVRAFDSTSGLELSWCVARGSSSNHGADSTNSGGPRAGQGSGASLGTPTCSSESAVAFPDAAVDFRTALAVSSPHSLSSPTRDATTGILRVGNGIGAPDVGGARSLEQHVLAFLRG